MCLNIWYLTVTPPDCDVEQSISQNIQITTRYTVGWLSTVGVTMMCIVWLIRGASRLVSRSARSVQSLPRWMHSISNVLSITRITSRSSLVDPTETALYLGLTGQNRTVWIGSCSLFSQRASRSFCLAAFHWWWYVFFPLIFRRLW